MTVRSISVGEEMNPSRRNTMEDSHVIHGPGTWKSPDPHMTYFAIHDGHGGRDIVDFLEEALADNVAQELAYNDDNDGNGMTCSSSSMETRLERAFLMTDIQSKQMGLITSGATVAVCLVSQQQNQQQRNNDDDDEGGDTTKTTRTRIHVANVGDARVVVACHDGRAHRLSFDHRADDATEVQRIEAAGGFVMRNRVTGILAVARSLGDHGLKDYVIAQPHVQSWEDGGDFVILACDGLFDVLTDQQVVDLVYQWRDRKDDVARLLCKEAVTRGSTDNITAIVAWL